MLGREVENEAMAGIAQEALTGGHRLEEARFPFGAEVDLEATVFGHQAHQRLRAVDVEVVHDQKPGGVRTSLGQPRGQPGGEIHFGAGGAEMVGDPAGDHIEGGDQRQCAVADVFVLAPFHQAWVHRQRRRGALQGLHAGHFIDTSGLDALFGPLGGQTVGLTDITTLVVEVRIARRVEPTAYMMGLDVDLTQEAPNGVGGNRRHDPALNGFGGQLRVRPAHQFALPTTRRLTGQGQDRTDLLRRKARRRAAARGIAQALPHRPIDRRLRPPPTPAWHHHSPDSQAQRRRADTHTGIGLQQNTRPLHQRLRCQTFAYQRVQIVPLFLRQMNRFGYVSGHPSAYKSHVQADDNLQDQGRSQDFNSVAVVLMPIICSYSTLQ